MFDFKEQFGEGITFISMKEDKLEGCFYYKMGEDYLPIPLEEKDLEFIKFYSNIMLKLQAGEKIYISANTMYLGNREFVGPYGDEEYFNSNYSSKSLELSELLIDLDKNIFDNNENPQKLIKIGNFYSVS